MEAARAEWTDKRLDIEFERADRRFERIGSRLDDLQRTMVVGVLSLATLIVAATGTLVTLYVTHG